MKMASTPTENKPFTARYGAAPIFMLGGAPRAHEVLSVTGFLAGAVFRPHPDSAIRKLSSFYGKGGASLTLQLGADAARRLSPSSCPGLIARCYENGLNSD